MKSGSAVVLLVAAGLLAALVTFSVLAQPDPRDGVQAPAHAARVPLATGRAAPLPRK